MSDDWDFYFARVNDAVTSIFVDLVGRIPGSGRRGAAVLADENGGRYHGWECAAMTGAPGPVN